MLEIVDIYLDGVAGGSGRPFSAGSILFLEAGTTFSGYLQQWIGDNQWDKKMYFRLNRQAGLRTRSRAEPGLAATKTGATL